MGDLIHTHTEYYFINGVLAGNYTRRSLVWTPCYWLKVATWVHTALCWLLPHPSSSLFSYMPMTTLPSSLSQVPLPHFWYNSFIFSHGAISFLQLSYFIFFIFLYIVNITAIHSHQVHRCQLCRHW